MKKRKQTQARPDGMSGNQWAVRVAFERGYRVCDDGRVIGPRGKFRKLYVHNNGFLRFTVRPVGTRRSVAAFVHQLAAFQLFGDYTEGSGEGSGEKVVMHLNGDRADNRLSNIALGTRTESHMRIARTLRVLYAVNAASKLRSLTDGEVASLRAERACGASLKDICAKYGIARSTASYIYNRRTYP
jgi:hypothetical protein